MEKEVPCEPAPTGIFVSLSLEEMFKQTLQAVNEVNKKIDGVIKEVDEMKEDRKKEKESRKKK